MFSKIKKYVIGFFVLCGGILAAFLSGKSAGKKDEKLKKTEIVYTLITRLELSKLRTEVERIDPDAFIVMHSIKDAKGGMIKKRPLK